MDLSFSEKNCIRLRMAVEVGRLVKAVKKGAIGQVWSKK